MTKPNLATVERIDADTIALRIAASDESRGFASLPLSHEEAGAALDALAAYFSQEDGGTFSAETIASI